MRVISFLRRWTLPVAMVVGIVLYVLMPGLFVDRSEGGMGVVSHLFPITLFVTLFATFARVDFRAMRLRRWHLALLLVQLVLVGGLLSAALAMPVASSAHLLLASLLTCAIAPCAAAAPVVTSQLGGNLSTMTTFMLLSCLLCVGSIPVAFSLVNPAAGQGLLFTALAILRRLAAVMLLPLACGVIVHSHVPRIHSWLTRHPQLSFYAWSLALAMVSGLTLHNILSAQTTTATLWLIALGSLGICLLNYLLGWLIGRRCPEFINARQGMFQKNTGLAIYIATTFLPPAAAIGAGCYVLWQNIVNSYELRKR